MPLKMLLFVKHRLDEKNQYLITFNNDIGLIDCLMSHSNVPLDTHL